MNTGLPMRAIQHDAEIQLSCDRQRLFHQQALHDAALGPGLVRDQPHAQHLFRDLDGFRRVLRYLDAAAFPAPAGMNLRFDDHAAADLFRRRFRLIHRKRDFAPRHRDSVFGQDRLGLILVNFHGIKELVYLRTMQWDRTRHLAEAFAFSLLVVAYIWVRPLWWSWSLLIPLALVVVSFVWHSETAESLGLSLRALAGAVAAWRWWLASCVASLLFSPGWRPQLLFT